MAPTAPAAAAMVPYVAYLLCRWRACASGSSGPAALWCALLAAQLHVRMLSLLEALCCTALPNGAIGVLALEGAGGQ